MSEGYDYADSTAGMDEALERARAAAHGGSTAELDALDEAIRKNWEGDSPPAGEAQAQPPQAMDTASAPAPSAEAAPVDLSTKPLEGPIQQTDGPPTPAGPPPVEPPKEPWALIKHELRQNDTRTPDDGPLAAKMKAVGWEPKPAPAAIGGPTDWAKLQADLQAAEHQADTQRTIGAALHAAAPGYEPPSNAGAGGVDAAKSAIDVHEKLLAESRQQDAAKEAAKKNAADEALRQQQLEASKADVAHKAQADLLAKAKEQAQNDPSSPESQHAREALRPIFSLAGGKPPEGYDGWSAADVERHAKTLSPVATGATARKKTEAELSDKEKAATEDAASLGQARASLAKDPRAGKLGVTPEAISAMGRKDLEDLQHRMDSLDKVKPHGTGAPAKPIHALSDIKDEGTRNEVAAILNDQQLLSNIPARGGRQEELRKAVLQVDPTYDETQAKIRYDLKHQQALAPDTTAMGVARHHLKLAEEALPANADANFVNRAKQAFAQGSGDPQFTKFNVASTVAAHEVAKVMKIDTEAGKAMVEHMMAPAQSRPQLLEVFRTIDDLIAGKQSGQKEQLDSLTSSWRKAHPAPTMPSTSGGEAPVLVRSKKDPSKSKLVSRERAKLIMSAPGAEEFEVVETPPAHGVK